MSNNRDRASRKRSSGDDHNTFKEGDDGPAYFHRSPVPSQRPPEGSSEVVDAEVLWFNTGKGFGFIKLSDGSEAFLHIGALEAAGHTAISEGSHLKVTLEDSAKGKQVSQVLDVSGGVPQSRTRQIEREPRGADRPTYSRSPEQEREGTVKFYNSEKGFGFIAIGDGEKDVFVHATALTRSGLNALEVGQRVTVSYSQGQKGLEARSVRLP